MAKSYVNFKRYSVTFDADTECFSVWYDGMGEVIRNLKIVSTHCARDPQPWPDGYEKPVTAAVSDSFDGASMTVVYSGEKHFYSDITIRFDLSDSGLRFAVFNESSATQLTGELFWGNHSQRQTMAVNLGSLSPTLRSAFGPAAGASDRTLFDRDTDSALSFETSGAFRLRYDWDRDCYCFTYDTLGKDYGKKLNIRVEKEVYERKFGYDYKKVNPHTTFPTPPVGWMTWYAVQFDACEKTVLENTKWQEEHLKKYGANSIWVDWEWYHPNYASVAAEGSDMFHPDKKMYPHGLAYLAEKIKESGFTPALWIGPICDSGKNELLEQHPDALLEHRAAWCGQNFFDPTNEHYLTEILPRMIKQVSDWGYRALKWDLMGDTLLLCDSFHDCFRPPQSTRQIMKNLFRIARQILGEDFYMLYCCGSTQRDMDLACGSFDATRVGGDIFRWDTFITQCIDKVCRFYALHDVVCNNDPDNVILREAFNSYDQAVTRAAFVSLLGLPFTMGDNLPELPEDRVEILRRSIPPIPAHPMDIRSTAGNHETQIINLAIEQPHLSYNVADVINLKEEPSSVRLSLSRDLDLERQENGYYLYDYWNKDFIGQVTDAFTVELRAHQSRIFAVHPVEAVPQLISTGRHITQGAMDVLALSYDAETRTLSGKSRVIGGEDYALVFCAPEGFQPEEIPAGASMEPIADTAWHCTLHPEADGERSWFIRFRQDAAKAK